MQIELTRNEFEVFINYRLDGESNFKLYDILEIKNIKRVD